MSVVRGILLVIVTVLLFLSFVAGILFLTLSLSINYDNLQKEATSTIKSAIQEQYNLAQEIENQYPLIDLYCKENADYVFSYEEFTIDVPCSVALQGTDAILDEGIRDVVHSIYYKEYDCSFLDCFKNSEIPLFLVSQKSYNFITSELYLLLAISLILLVAMFFLYEKKTNMLIVTGILLMISSLLFIKLDALLLVISNKTISKILGIFFSKAYFLALRVLIAGIIVIIIGMILKIFKAGFFIHNTISKLKKKKEIKPEIKPQPKSEIKSQSKQPKSTKKTKLKSK